MEIADLVTPASVIANLRAANKRQALQELAKRAAALTGRHERAIFEVLLERERLNTTGIGNGTALPTKPTGNDHAANGNGSAEASGNDNGRAATKPHSTAGKPPAKTGAAPAVRATPARTPSRPLNGRKAQPAALDPGKVAKAGPNDPCPCGSGKKYKKCGGA